MKRWSVLMTGCVPAALLSLALAADTDDEKAVRAVVERYFALYAKKDLDGAMALWSARAPDARLWRGRLEKVFAETGPLTLKKIEVLKVEALKDGLRLRVRVELTGDRRDGKPHPGLGVFTRALSLVKEEAGWKLVGYESPEAALARALGAAAPAERKKLLDAERELVGPDLVKALLREGTGREDKGAPAEALPYDALAVELAERLGDRPRLAEALVARGRLLGGKLGRWAEALPDYQRARGLYHDLKDRAGEAIALFGLGMICRGLERPEDAIGYYRDALALSRDLKDRAGEAITLRVLGGACRKLKRPEEAIRYYRDSLTLHRELKDRKNEAMTLDDLGSAYEDARKWTEALAAYEERLKVVRALDDRAGEAATLLDIGRLRQAAGRPAEALAAYQERLKVARELRDRAGEAETLLSIGGLREETGRYAEALRRFEEGLKISRELRDRNGISAALTCLGIFYQRTGRYADALRQHEESLKIERDLGDRSGEAAALANLGTIDFLMGRDADALQRYEESLKILRELEDQGRVAAVLRNIGAIEKDQGRYPEALHHVEEALKLYRELGNREGEAVSLFGIGLIYHLSGRPTEALPRFDASLRIAEAMGHVEGCLHCESGRGKAYRQLGERLRSGVFGAARARATWRRGAAAFAAAIDRLAALRGNTREPLLQASLVDQYTGPFYGLVDCQLLLDQVPDAFATSERMRSASLLDLLSGGKVDVRKGMTEDERAAEQRLQDRLTALGVQIEKLRGFKAGADRLGPLLKEQGEARAELDAFRRKLYVERPEVRARRAGFSPAALTELNQKLFARHPGLVVLSYLTEYEQPVLFVLSRGERTDGPARLEGHRLDFQWRELADAVRAFRAACQTPGVAPSSDDLYRWLLAPAEDAFDAAKHVVIVPDGVLHTLPFHAMRPDEEGKYLVERCTVSYAPSLTALLQMQQRGDQLRKQHGKEESLLAVGIGDFGRREKPLPRAEAEAKAVAGLFGARGTALLGAEATRGRLEAAWAKARYLHLATHGLLNEAQPFYSSVVLSRDKDDEGQLFARDLLDADLRAELAVLSACQTGLGQRLYGEGLLGLSWAWFVAGVPSVIASQWPVSDQATETLMTAFWSEVKAGTPHAEALRRAQRRLLKDKGTRHPYYWAPFVLVGDLGG